MKERFTCEGCNKRTEVFGDSFGWNDFCEECGYSLCQFCLKKHEQGNHAIYGD